MLVRVVARSEDEATTTTRLALLIQHRFFQEHVLLRVLQRGLITNLELLMTLLLSNIELLLKSPLQGLILKAAHGPRILCII